MGSVIGTLGGLLGEAAAERIPGHMVIDAGGPPGTTRPGTACGTARISTPRTSNTAAVPYVAVRRHGSVFSTAISPAMTTIHKTLMMPRANRDAMRAQQQPRHHAPFFSPIRTPPSHPSRQ